MGSSGFRVMLSTTRPTSFLACTTALPSRPHLSSRSRLPSPSPSPCSTSPTSRPQYQSIRRTRSAMARCRVTWATKGEKGGRCEGSAWCHVVGASIASPRGCEKRLSVCVRVCRPRHHVIHVIHVIHAPRWRLGGAGTSPRGARSAAATGTWGAAARGARAPAVWRRNQVRKVRGRKRAGQGENTRGIDSRQDSSNGRIAMVATWGLREGARWGSRRVAHLAVGV